MSASSRHDYYNPAATLFFTTGDKTIEHLLSRNTHYQVGSHTQLIEEYSKKTSIEMIASSRHDYYNPAATLFFTTGHKTIVHLYPVTRTTRYKGVKKNLKWSR
jgi:hypothetical protein